MPRILAALSALDCFERFLGFVFTGPPPFATDLHYFAGFVEHTSCRYNFLSIDSVIQLTFLHCSRHIQARIAGFRFCNHCCIDPA